MNAELGLAVVLPLVGAALCLLAGPRGARWIACVAAPATTVVAFIVAASVANRGPMHHPIGGFGAPLGIELRADGLAAVMLVTIGLVAGLVSVAAWRDRTSASSAAGSFFALWLFAWAALNALVLSADLFNLYVTLELVTLAAVALVASSSDRDALRAALRYLLVALPGSLIYLLGVALLYGMHASLDARALGASVDADPITVTALTLITLGLCLKAAVFPLHGWLPPAYVSAGPMVAAFVSALVGKGPFYILLRIWLDVVPDDVEGRAAPLLGALGAGSVLWAASMALRQRRLKALVAYSSVSQVGYLFLLFPLGTEGAFRGAVVLAISHAAAAASMFLAAFAIERAVGHDELDGLRGLAHHLPMTFVTLALSGIGLMGMPPSGGFVAKWLLLQAAFETDQWWFAIVVSTGGLLAAAYVFRVLRGAFLPIPAGLRIRATARGSERVAFTLALVSVLLGLAPMMPIGLLDVGSVR
jgi:multicomponent Na+:H+ antiporter subunit D